MKDNKEKKHLTFLIVGLASISIFSATLFSLFGNLFRFKAQSILWPLAIIFLVYDLIFCIIPALDLLPVKKQKLIKRIRIVFSLIGGTLFIIDSFVFIDNLIYSFMLVTMVFCLFIGLIFLKKLFKSYFQDND